MQHRNRIRIIDGLRSGAIVFAVFLLFANVRTASAHGGVEHVKGTVAKVSADAVTVTTTDNKAVEVGLTSLTKFTRDDKAIGAGELKVGDRVVVDAKLVNKKPVADLVKLGVSASKSAHGAPATK